MSETTRDMLEPRDTQKDPVDREDESDLSRFSAEEGSIEMMGEFEGEETEIDPRQEERNREASLALKNARVQADDS